MTRIKSPNYPAIDLRNAVNRVEKIYGRERTHYAQKEIIAQALEYSGLNGASRRIIAALERFGLLDENGDASKVSETALLILRNPSGHPKRVEALKDMYLRPKVFLELYNRYGDSLPSNRNIESFLTIEGFSDEAARKVVKTYRDTVEFVKEEETLRIELEGNARGSADESYEEVGSKTNEHENRNPQRVSQSQPKNSPINNAIFNTQVAQNWGKFFHVPISDNVEFQGAFKGPVTQAEVDTVISFLNFFKQTVPKELQASNQSSKNTEPTE